MRYDDPDSFRRLWHAMCLTVDLATRHALDRVEAAIDADEEPAAATAPAGRHRRRAAIRPAGPPIHES